MLYQEAPFFCELFTTYKLLTNYWATMEKAVNYEMQERRDGDNLQLISGTVASNSPQIWDRTDRKEAKRTSCMQQCCMIFIAMIAVLALCAAAAAIVLVLAYPNVANPAVQEVLVLKDQLAAQLASTSSPSTNADATSISEEIKMVREILQSSLNSIDASLQASLNSIGNSIEASLNATSSSIKTSLNSIGPSIEAAISVSGSSIEASLNSIGASIEGSLNTTSSSMKASLDSIGSSVEASLSSIGTSLDRLVEGEG